MSDASAIDYGAGGSAIAVCDGPELLVYGGDGSPQWKQFCEGVLVGVRLNVDMVAVLDADGRLTRFRRADGRVHDKAQIEGQAMALELSSDGVLLVRTDADLVLVEGSSTLPLNQGTTTAAAFGPDRGSVGIGWPNGTFRAMDLSTGAVLGEQALGSAVTAVAWSPAGKWVVAAGPQLFVVAGNGQAILGTIDLGGPCPSVAVNDGGVLVAAQVGDGRVLFAELHRLQQAGFVEFRRPVGGVSWGPGGLLAIGLDDGDASRIDVFSGASIRTEPHPGRGRNTWNYEDKIDKEVLRGATAFTRAGTDKLARYEGAPKEGWPIWQTCLVVFLAVGFVSITCTGCAGLGYYLHTIGVF